MKLADVIDAYISPDKETSLESALSKVDDIGELVAEAKAKSAELALKEAADLSEEDVQQLETCTKIMKVARARREKAAAEEAEKAAELERLDRIDSLKKSVTEISAELEKDEPVTKESVLSGEALLVEPVEEQPVATSQQVEPAVEPSKELVGVGAETFRSVSSLASAPPPKAVSLVGSKLNHTYSVDGGGLVTDRKYDSMAQIAEVMLSQLRSYPLGGEHKNVIASFKRDNIEEFNVYGRQSDALVIDNIVRKAPIWDRTSGQFAAGWCAPSEPLYELCPQVTSLDGILDVPEVVATRGGVLTTAGPNFSTLYANAAIGQVLTEAQVIAGTTKTCIEIDCPPFVETRLDVNPLCITGNLLTQAGYPEYVERFIREAVAANAHKINLNILNRMVTASTAVTLPGATGPVDTSSASWFLDAASLYATWLRDRYRLRQDALIEVVAPYWYFQQQYSDLARRNGVDLLTSEARLTAAFADRNIRVQWVYDWQPMASTAAGAAARPTTAQILVYIPGTFVKLTSPVINLGTIHSAAQLATNQYTALFVEEGFNVLERCFESLAITVPTCPSGTTGIASGSCDSTP